MKVFPTATVIHRLDMATSGILVFALNKPAHVNLCRQFQERKIRKYYKAIVSGQLPSSEGSVDLPLIADWPNRPRQKVDYEKGKASLTHYQLIRSYPGCCEVGLKPVTGRSHQLRVHMLHLGCPIVGDRLYAPPEKVAMASRLCLHATEIEFAHPSTNLPCRFENQCNLTDLLLK